MIYVISLQKISTKSDVLYTEFIRTFQQVLKISIKIFTSIYKVIITLILKP